MSNFEFRDEPRTVRLLITSQWIWIEKNTTVHLHYFIHRVRQNCQTSHFPFLHERFLVSFFKYLNLKNHWCDDVTWLLSTNFMRDRQGECLGKISHPYRVWKVYKQKFSENTKLALGRTLNMKKKKKNSNTVVIVSRKIKHLVERREHATCEAPGLRNSYQTQNHMIRTVLELHEQISVFFCCFFLFFTRVEHQLPLFSCWRRRGELVPTK